MPGKGSQGPQTFKGGERVFTEQELGTMEKSSMDPQGKPGSGVPQHMSSRFGSNLVENDKTPAYNPGDRASPGVPTHQVGSRFGAVQDLPDKTPALNPDK